MVKRSRKSILQFNPKIERNAIGDTLTFLLSYMSFYFKGQKRNRKRRRNKSKIKKEIEEDERTLFVASLPLTSSLF